MLGEQGWLGLILWLLLHALGVWQMERIRWRFAQDAEEQGNKSWQWGLATALQQSQIVYLVGALFVGIAYQPFIFMLVGLQCALWSYVQRTESVPQQGEVQAAARRETASGRGLSGRRLAPWMRRTPSASSRSSASPRA